jgi:8-oxo-dGTP pyrophosphatase MutT (NUDIX family)
MIAPDTVLAAGAVCWKITKKGKLRILVVHRTQHRDVSLPKGKVEPGETLPETAVREIAEETGLLVALGTPLGIVEYALPTGRSKAVYYWAAQVDRHQIANSTFASNEEIENLTWMSIKKARSRLTYPHDVDIVERFVELAEQGRAATFAIVVVRHGKAVPRERWDGSDASRPLQQRGIAQSTSIAPGIAAFRPGELVSSSAVRCVSTLSETARLTGLEVTEAEAISQDAFEADGAHVDEWVGAQIGKLRSMVLCSHGPVLPQIVKAVARATSTVDFENLRRAALLSTGEYAILHVSRDRPTTGVVAVEVHSPPI